MRWLQIVVERSDERTTLTVNDEMCEIAGKIFLAEKNIKGTFNVSTMEKDDILPPKAPGALMFKPYQILFIGGVPRAQLSNKNRRTKCGSTTYYITDIPSILGCMKGDVRVGCNNDCDSLVCNNGGHCTVQWYNYNPPNKDPTSCDCSKTSYGGSNCHKDDGVRFIGLSAILFNMPRRLVLNCASDEQTFQFAFAPTLGNHQIQRLATIYFDDNRQFQVTLNQNDSITVSIVNPNNYSAKMWTFAGNFSDGYRHFFQSTFTQQDPILVLVDSEKKYLDDDIRLHLADARAFYFAKQGIVQFSTWTPPVAPVNFVNVTVASSPPWETICCFQAIPAIPVDQDEELLLENRLKIEQSTNVKVNINEAYFQSIIAESKEARMKAVDYELENKEYKARVTILEQHITQLENIISSSKVDIQKIIQESYSGLEFVKEDVVKNMSKFAYLMELKVKLDAELETYRLLLDAGQIRIDHQQNAHHHHTARSFVKEGQSKEDVQIDEVNLDGKYICLTNKGTKEFNLGSWLIEAHAGNNKREFKFSASQKVMPGKSLKIWSPNMGGTPNSPNSIVLVGAPWPSGDRIHVKLFNTHGHERAWHESYYEEEASYSAIDHTQHHDEIVSTNNAIINEF
uniref:LTD domain-containing protein n=1 Tax=Acrobeloides nanus TaxID=290746 RepID=A0A914CT43_9BILA